MLAKLGGRPLVRHAVERLLESGVDDVIVVTRSDGYALRTALKDLPVTCIENADAANGMSASLAAGLRALPEAAEAVIVALGDQPTISAGVIDRLITTWRASGTPIVVPTYAGVQGHPVLFARAMFPELLAVRGDQGGREIIARDAHRVTYVDVDEIAPVDVDVREDLAKLELDSSS